MVYGANCGQKINKKYCPFKISIGYKNRSIKDGDLTKRSMKPVGLVNRSIKHNNLTKRSMKPFD